MKELERKEPEMTVPERTVPESPQPDALVDILAHEEEIQPMIGFSTRVLRRIREETAMPAPMAFPWARFVAGFVVNLGLLFGAGVWRVLESGGSSRTPAPPPEWLSHPQVAGLIWVALAVVGTGFLAWTASRWVVPRSAGAL